jgi:transcriptional regulator with XRE-family HTH domain
VPTPREQLAAFLKKARLDAGYESHARLAKHIHVSRPVVSKAENPTQPVPSDSLLAAWAGATGIGQDILMDLAVRCRSGTPEWFMPYLVAESQADALRCWSPLVVPGLLQTEPYARAVLSVEPYSPKQLEEFLDTRMQRQQVLDRAYLTVVIDHAVLQRCLGSPAVMAEQCAHLLTVASRPNVAFHVVPEGGNVGLWGAYDIAAKDNMLTVRMSGLEDVPSTATALTAKAVQAFERILGSAMPRAESLEFTREMESQWKTRI